MSGWGIQLVRPMYFAWLIAPSISKMIKPNTVRPAQRATGKAFSSPAALLENIGKASPHSQVNHSQSFEMSLIMRWLISTPQVTQNTQDDQKNQQQNQG
jgi:hypothetical protein